MDSDGHIPEYLRGDFEVACQDALRLTLETVAVTDGDEWTFRFLLMTVAALRGYQRLAYALAWSNSLDPES